MTWGVANSSVKVALLPTAVPESLKRTTFSGAVFSCGPNVRLVPVPSIQVPDRVALPWNASMRMPNLWR